MSVNWQKDILNKFSNVEINADMKKFTNFKIGGLADVLATPDSYEELIEMYLWCINNNINISIIGKGTNLLVSDKGVRGIVIRVADNLSKIVRKDNIIIAQAGALLSSVAKTALNAQLAGLEFASGIPGSIGGAVYMNAGAYEGEMNHVVTKAKIVTRDGKTQEWDNKRLSLEYRSSAVATEKAIILEVETTLHKGAYQDISDKMNLLNGKRREKQPLNMPSAGSTFKRPPGIAGSYLIDKVGLKGHKIGGAQVSTKHAGFIINTGDARAQDVLNLMAFVQNKVYQEEGILLQPEVRFLGEEQESQLIRED